MKVTHWLTAIALALLASVGTSLQAGLLDRLSEASEQRVERGDAESPESFAVASREEIGKIVTPVAYQTLAAPAGGTLTPVPESYGAPSTAPPPVIQSYPPAVPTESFPMTGPAFPTGPQAYPIGPHAYPVGPQPGFGGFPLFPRVKIEDPRHIHPCATPTVVQVLDPCADDCDSCGPRCVYVEICVPPGCPEIKVRRRGKKVKYDYGDYKVVVTSKDGYVEVDYDD